MMSPDQWVSSDAGTATPLGMLRPDAAGQPSTTPRVWLRLVGEFAVYRAGMVVPARDVGSRKARVLLALLAVHRRQFVPIDQIIDVVWEASPPQRPQANIATLVSRVRVGLGRDVVAGRSTGYRLGEQVGVDLDDATELAGLAEAALVQQRSAVARLAAVRGLKLLDGGVVVEQHPHAPWAEPARRRHLELLRRLRHAGADAALQGGDALAAAAVSQDAIDADPLDEVACRALMQSRALTGEPAKALAAYERLRAGLAHLFGADPAPMTQALHSAILRKANPGLVPPAQQSEFPPVAQSYVDAHTHQ